MSWVIVEKETGRAVCETFSEQIARAINTAKYDAIPAGTYLQELNARIHAARLTCGQVAA